MMSDTNELRAAAERLRTNADAEYTKMSPLLYFADCETLANGYLAEHPADDGEPVASKDIPRNDVVSIDEYGTLTICNGKIHHVTRGDVRRLAQALGITLKEGGA